ncbi:MAG: hypothetical protein Q8K91_15150 [Hylemonella sp.]|nr:hypothetical protein [Hylemonella sp.]
MAAVQQLTDGTGLAVSAARVQLRPQTENGLLECAAVVVLLVGLAVALEASPLVDVEKGAGKLGWCQRFVQALGAQGIGVECDQ